MADEKIRQIRSILCDADQSVWQWLSNYLHTHAQVSGMNLECCKIPTSFQDSPINSTTKWIPVEKMPDIKLNAYDKISRKIINSCMVQFSFKGGLEEGIVKKCDKNTVTIFIIDKSLDVKVSYKKVVSVHSSIVSLLSGWKLDSVKEALKSIQ